MAGRLGSLLEYRDSSLILLQLLLVIACCNVSAFTCQFLCRVVTIFLFSLTIVCGLYCTCLGGREKSADCFWVVISQVEKVTLDMLSWLSMWRQAQRTVIFLLMRSRVQSLTFRLESEWLLSIIQTTTAQYVIFIIYVGKTSV